jgi:hypothetical protein
MQDFLDIPFETEKEEATPPFALLPSGVYKAEIVAAQAGGTKNQKGYQVRLSWSIIEGEFEHRILFQNILLQHESEEAQRYGRQKFKDVLVALGITENVTDLSVMYHRPSSIGVKIREDKSGQYEPRNEIGRVMPLPASHNGPTRAAIAEAQKVQPAFKPVNGKMNDSIPF